MDDSSRLLREWRLAKDNLRATNLAFAAAVGRSASQSEQLALAREVACLQEEERRLAAAATRLRMRRGFWMPSTIPSTLPSALG